MSTTAKSQDGIIYYLLGTGEGKGKSFSFHNLGAALWDYQRDKQSIQAYFSQLAKDRALATFSAAWSGYRDEHQGQSSLLGEVSGYLESATGRKVLGTAATIYGAVQAATGEKADATSGAISGAMTGFSVGGPLGALAGAIAGGLLGGNTAAKRATEEAAKQRERMIAELRKLNNNLLPVSDYFRQGMFSPVPNRMTFGAGLSLADSLAAQTSRGGG